MTDSLFDLIGNTDPSCRYGHGRLERVPGIFGMPEFTKSSPGIIGQQMESAQQGPRYSATGQLFTLVVYRCPRCGALQLFDSESA